MSDLQFQLLSQKIDNVFSSLSTRMDQIDENKTVKAENQKLNESIKLLTTSNTYKDTIITNLQEELDDYKRKENQANLIQATPALKGAAFEKETLDMFKQIFHLDGNVVSETNKVPHSADKVLSIQNFFKFAVDDKKRKVKISQKGVESCDINADDVQKLQHDAKNVNANAAILIYPKLDAHNGLYDFAKDDFKCDSSFNKNMMMACTPERICEAMLTLMARNDHNIQTITKENTTIVDNLLNIISELAPLVKPILQSFAPTSTNSDDLVSWGKRLGMLVHKLRYECETQKQCDANMSTVYKNVHSVLEALPTDKGSMFMKRKLEKQEDASNKKLKTDDTGQTLEKN